MTCLPGYQQSFFSCLQALLYFFWISLKPERELKYGGYNTKIILNFITIMRAFQKSHFLYICNVYSSNVTVVKLLIVQL